MAEHSPSPQHLAEIVESWRGHDVLVIGDVMLDEWRFAESDRLCREAPAPVLTLRRRQASAGGAANTAVNLAALGAQVRLVAPVGTDVAGDELHDCLDQAGVHDRTVTQPGWSTPIKRRLLAGDQILVREDEGDSDEPLTESAIWELLGSLTRTTDELRDSSGLALVVCDYGLGALPEAVRSWLVAHREAFTTVALDAHDLAGWQGLAPTVVTPSFAEAVRLFDARPTASPPTLMAGSVTEGCSPVVGGTDRATIAQAHLAQLRARTGAEVVAVTLDGDGTLVAGEDGHRHRSHANPVPASHTVGAGDAYLAAMTLALAVGAPVPAATQLAQIAATSTVTGTGTCVCNRQSLLAALGPPGGSETTVSAGVASGTGAAADGDIGPSVVADSAALATLIARHRRDGRAVVFTNGCFDVLHRGHVHYLAQARELGDLLVVAVNSDESVRRLKGDGRPVNPVEDRVAVLAALTCVDHVVVFEEDSPAALIEAVRPDIYVKGGDYPPEMVPEAPLVRRLGGQVHTLGYVPDRSTSAIIDRIRSHSKGRGPSYTKNDNKGPFLSESPP